MWSFAVDLWNIEVSFVQILNSGYVTRNRAYIVKQKTETNGSKIIPKVESFQLAQALRSQTLRQSTSNASMMLSTAVTYVAKTDALRVHYVE